MRAMILGAAMGLTVAALPAVATSTPSGGTPGGIVGVSYSMAAAPKAGLDSITYPLTVLRNANPKASWYWADELEFVGDSSIAYMGLQPNGEYGKTALFSVFGGGTVGHSASCRTGADGGSGTSCHISYHWHRNRTYLFTAALVSAGKGRERWRGTVTDTTTLVRTTIGIFTVAAARGLVAPYLGFSEYFSSVSACSAVPRMVVRYGAPTGTAAGASYRGQVDDAYAYGGTGNGYIDCRAVGHPRHSAASALVQIPKAGYSAPHGPTRLRARTIKNATERVLTWKRPAAAHRIASYRVYRNGKRVASVASARYVDHNTHNRKPTRYVVAAVDTTGQVGPDSHALATSRRQ